MLLWKPLAISPLPKQGNVFSVSGAAAKQGRHVALYFTPERGWYGWASTEEWSETPAERIYPILTCDNGIQAVPGSIILKAADAIRTEAPDEIATT